MLPHFVDRERELEFLESIYRESGFNLVVLYGRRRVGKTELIRKFIEKKRGCYVLLTNESVRENLGYVKEGLAKALGKDHYRILEVDSFYQLFRAVEFDEDRIIIALDEFPYLLELNRGLLSTFQKIVDEILSRTNVMLILCGSSMSMMENEVLGYRSPLYGRRVRAWKVQPFTFDTVYSIIGDIEEAAKVFFTFGNIPYYLSLYDQRTSLEKNIRETILTKGAPLYDEPLILLRQEFRQARTYQVILKYISLGYRSLGKLCSATGMDRSNLSKYLSTLIEMGIVEHVLPFGRRRGGIYEISDPFVDFWFRYVAPHRSALEIGDVDTVLGAFRSDQDRYFGHRFERLVLELLERKTFPELAMYGEFSRWWHKGEEIDIVGRRGDSLLLCECKWGQRVDGKELLNRLREKASSLHWDEELEYALFARSFTTRPEGAHVYSFGEIEERLSAAAKHD